MRETFTVGQSTHPIEEFAALLQAHGVSVVVDIRSIPRSRHIPQFGEDELRTSRPGFGLGCRRLEALGGLRRTMTDMTTFAQVEETTITYPPIPEAV
ncbi:DUF488 domain-containing protein [Mycetocola miduiensis]|uniref:Uncharacterized protein n=1 Tax=Mycetocola miduiensis TaxID=995034 RepID=A0A1I5CQT7_9MICO|nr:DUF488 domain-containing protein [Mycetocola miduiensis]SFN89292.1 Protein of unknown function, DUF488 [Mycetocola miduiensis]